MRLELLKVGQSVADMHDGLPFVDQLFGPGVEQGQHLTVPTADGHRVIETMLQAKWVEDAEAVACRTYTNKMLVLVAVAYDWGRYVFAYSMDNHTLGFIEYRAG